MTTDSCADSWSRFKRWYWEDAGTGLALDASRVAWPEGFHERMQSRISAAFEAMAQLEAGSIANPDEGRMVGHYWLRTPELAPKPELRAAIEGTLTDLQDFAEEVNKGTIKGQSGRFTDLLVIGIGGSALGPQFVSNALAPLHDDTIRFHSLDNTDPDGMDRVLGRLSKSLYKTLTIVISKSGGTKETRNGMLEAKHAYEAKGLSLAKHAVAVTQAGSELDKLAVAEGWLRRFPMWDWVGGRTSELSAVGLLPAAIQRIDIVKLLQGARAVDRLTRIADWRANPAMQLALSWFVAGDGVGNRHLVVLPYKDRLELFSKYLQQLIMESIGKELDLAGNVVRQGLTVLGNKGSTDQHSFVQQLRDGRNDFLAIFIEVLSDRDGTSIEVEPGLTSGDFLQGFYLGTRYALSENGRQSVSITIPAVSELSVGGLIALFERAVGFYASLVGINAYHQPGVEAGKRAANGIVKLKQDMVKQMRSCKGDRLDVQDIAKRIGSEDCETVFKLCKRLAVNRQCGIAGSNTHDPATAKFWAA